MTEARPSRAIVTEALETVGELDFRIIELFFFAYREFTADADIVLERYGFGRAHHRVLHFVNRAPGMTIADLLDLLQITKQSLGRVLRQLVDGGFVEQLPGSEDRRQRRLFPTTAGRELTLELSRAQAHRIEAALTSAREARADPVASFLLDMAGDRDSTKIWFDRNGIGPRAETGPQGEHRS
ncbi:MULTISPECIES: MarR family winged helix-turn-helix transcriptional regulator [unclassified Aureimonas]|uniref:MarR family winged helix-turn-helix transcriptional regulator n=1 Tax=unclassified Aureimonas TaxID=2615206 RepID=UPI0006FFA61E|nr:MULTISPECIES: MarR family transcriptional regulator [unclassified Aureimonas]KQT66170.1 MarR family transcriptional regulator [Aureimonas sp. Leaf427]KQT81068.1 MarR family transcriptional regulator [Aureimonas sp. Leaf460]